MTRNEAIENLKEFIDTYITCHGEEDTVAVSIDNVDVEALDMAIEALEQLTSYEQTINKLTKAISEQEPCADAISRQAVQDYIAKYLSQYLYNDIREAVEVIDEYIGELPSVKPQEKIGHWISHYDEDAKEGWYECDRCHTERAFNTNYCPDCGARMIEPQESEG